MLLQHVAVVAEQASGAVGAAPNAWLAGGIFLACYAVVMSERFNRANVALLAAGLMIFSRILTQQEAIAGIDFNTIGLLIGMMLIVSVTQQTGIFQFLAVSAAHRARGNPWGILLLLGLVTAVTSALLDNVTTVLLIVPVTLAITEELEVSPYPFLFSQILCSNIGGAATLIGDPPNILIGSQVSGLSFADFMVNLAPAALVVLAATFVPIWLVWGRRLHASAEARARVMAFIPREAITDPALLKKCLIVIALVIIGFVIGHGRGLEPATVALTGGALLMLLSNLDRKIDEKNERVHHFFGHVEWTTIFFFVGLFIVVAGIERAGILAKLSALIVDGAGGDRNAIAYAVLWVSAIASAVVDNIPFVATMIPTLKGVVAELGLGAEEAEPLWWSLSLGACLGGNGSLIGASANLIVAGFAERAGQPIRFLTFLKHSFPLMLMSIAICHVYLWLRYLS
ncbi:MAG: ArsB/NhaD family transporter [Planctomycetota bacterium]|nr:ArsB/NhaD family transporter [Planctomycetota bacterium]